MTAIPSSLALTTIADGSQIVAADHRNNYTSVQTAVNGLITLAAAGTSGQLLVSGGSTAATWTTAGSFLQASQKYGTLITIASSVTETDILQAAGYTIPAGLLGTTGWVRVTILGRYLQNSGIAATAPTLRVYLGGTKIIDSNVGLNLGDAANSYAFRVQAEVANRGATNSQVAHLEGRLSGPSSATLTTGVGIELKGGGSFQFAGIDTTAAIDTTATAALRVTAQLSSSHASHTLLIYSSLIEFL